MPIADGLFLALFVAVRLAPAQTSGHGIRPQPDCGGVRLGGREAVAGCQRPVTIRKKCLIAPIAIDDGDDDGEESDDRGEEPDEGDARGRK